jgi:chromosome segregation protein
LYLSKLELFGFKSFANKTVVNFTKGVTGIVGPNGSGKTNIVDAIRWVLGEQKSAVLRSDKMENVIFNGTRQRKPMGMAEVSLTLLNENGELQTDYTEVKVTRRIFRSGESEYLLNNNICRLKDITNLFMDTGVAASAYSVIELKMIETILSSKADERRKLFEEAAGVNKYKMRRRLSLKKLDDVKADLTRVNDIVAEVEKNVRSLERQAKKANKYNQIQSILREKELNLAEHEFALYNKKLSSLNADREQLDFRKNDIDNNIREIENELIEIRNKISEIEKELNSKRLEISTISEKLHESQKNLSVNEEKLHSLHSNIHRYENELLSLSEEKETNENLIKENQIKINEIQEEISQKEKLIAEETESWEATKKGLNEAKQSVKEKNDSLLETVKEINRIENQLQYAKANEVETNKKIEEINEKIQKITDKIAKSTGFLEELSQEKIELQGKIEKTDSLLLKKQKEKEVLEKEIAGLREKELEEKSAINNIKNKIEFLQNLITNLEGVSKGSKILLESEGWTTKDKNLITDVAGTSSDKYRYALNAALKNVLNNLLIDNMNDLKKAIGYLEKNELGKASFILLSAGNGKKGFSNKLKSFAENRMQKKLKKEKGVIGWAFDFVQTETKWKPFFNKLLRNTVVADNLDTAFALIKDYPDYNFVTLKGDFVQSNGIVEAGSEPKLDETLFGRKQMLEDLVKQLPSFEAKLKELQNLIAEKEKQLSEIDLNHISSQGKILLNDLNQIEKQISQFEFENEKASEEIEDAQTALQKLARESNDWDNKSNELKERLSEKNILREKTQTELSEKENILKEIENTFNLKLNEINNLKLEAERLRGELQNKINSTQRAERAIENIKATEEKRREEIRNSTEEIEAIKNNTEEIKTLHQELLQEKDKLKSEENEIEEKLRSIRSQSTELENDLSVLRNDREKISDEIYKIDIEKNKLTFELQNITENIKESYSVELELKEFEDLESFNYNAEADEVQTLKAKIKNLGPINLLAYSEYEEEKERLDFLHRQRDDLIESEKDLVNTIKEINETAEKNFLETFEKIRQNFKEIFQTLFNEGDEADLKLEEGVDPLEAKIEISAKPRGKRPTSIELLSQGEKTLTAIALLFAIYLVKPSPFCIWDEIDAPLDDASVSRFTKLLKEFSDKTQFIIITHNKRTMEAAENMYGVTVQEEGISKLVGVQFNEQLSEATNN